MLVFDPDVYGTYARRSALADYIELIALLGGLPVRKAEIADFVEQNGDEGLYVKHFLPVGQSRSIPSSGEVADSVFTALSYRQDTLGSAYPFNSSLDQIERIPRESHHHPYLFLLALTVAHAYAVSTEVSIDSIFEVAVETAIARRVGLGTAFWRHRQPGVTFSEAVAMAASAIDLKAIPEDSHAVVSTWAQDEGLDVLGHLSWNDDRAGQWVFVGQATVGQSDTWKQKASEVRVPQWSDLLGLQLPASGFLAVPHHVEPDHWAHLLYSNRVLLDRLRLVQAIDVGDDHVTEFAEFLLSFEVESLFPT